MNKEELITAFKLADRTSSRGANSEWERYTSDISAHVLKDDDPDNFLQWPAIENTMFVGDNRVTRKIYSDMMANQDTLARARLATRYDSFGGAPFHSRYDGMCTNHLHQFYALSLWEENTGKHIEDAATVVEFGGGYGAMRRVVHNLGFGGDYYIYDLPELSLLQQYYLSHFSIPIFANYMDDYRFPVPPNNVDVLIALWSLSEVPTQVRDAFFWSCKPQTCLFAYQDVFDNIDNVQYFRFLRERNPQYRWTPIPHPTTSGQFYLIGDQS